MKSWNYCNTPTSEKSEKTSLLTLLRTNFNCFTFPLHGQGVIHSCAIEM